VFHCFVFSQFLTTLNVYYISAAFFKGRFEIKAIGNEFAHVAAKFWKLCNFMRLFIFLDFWSCSKTISLVFITIFFLLCIIRFFTKQKLSASLNTVRSRHRMLLEHPPGPCMNETLHVRFPRRSPFHFPVSPFVFCRNVLSKWTGQIFRLRDIVRHWTSTYSEAPKSIFSSEKTCFRMVLNNRKKH